MSELQNDQPHQPPKQSHAEELLYHQINQPLQQDHDASYPQTTEAKAEELLAEDQAGFRPDQSAVDQIFNSRVIIEKRLQ